MKNLVVLALACFFFQMANGQEGPEESPKDPFEPPRPEMLTVPEKDEFEMPTLEAVIDSALKNSPLLKVNLYRLATHDQKVLLNRKSWLDNISIQGNTSYGIFNQLASQVSQESGVQTNFNSLNQTARGQYFVGVSMRVPVSVFASRKQRRNIDRLERETMLWEHEQIKNDIRRIIIEEFYALRSLKESLDVLRNLLESVRISYVIAKKDVENRRMGLDDFGGVAAIFNKAQIDYSKTKNEFYRQLELIEMLAGAEFR
ncbi:MAG: TolC family protein [Saprospiraceae bacterium]|nr:TolC family protein [Saprospiraceae bacterium]